MDQRFETIRWTDAGVVLIDQRRLPEEEVYLTCREPEEVVEAIRTMAIRGAPAIGVAAAMGLALGALRAAGGDRLEPRFRDLCDRFARSRPTGANLFWAIDRMRGTFEANRGRPPAEVADRLVAEAGRIRDEDVAANRRMGEIGAALLPESGTVLTHCNA
ncbi:MAG: S-methyl-5-thioribose-1-phosphate isomerase, partial [Acidobacteria bacterium]|nr:S-methyl-5-thioribose-1-phosphate isomerase [Acidobacteriota bacterium]